MWGYLESNAYGVHLKAVLYAVFVVDCRGAINETADFMPYFESL